MKKKPKTNLKLVLLCHQENINRIKKLCDDSAFIYSLCTVAGYKEKPNSIELKIGVVSDSNINDK